MEREEVIRDLRKIIPVGNSDTLKKKEESNIFNYNSLYLFPSQNVHNRNVNKN